MKVGTAAELDQYDHQQLVLQREYVQGWYCGNDSHADASTFTDVTVTNCTFNDNLQKGIYVEKLENAVFDGITVHEQRCRSGIRLQQRHRPQSETRHISEHSDPQFLDHRFSGATGTATDLTDPVAVTIKARNDGSLCTAPTRPS